MKQLYLIQEQRETMLSLSGGKNSTALLFLLKERNEDPDYVVYCDTSREYEDVLQFIQELDFILDQPIITFRFTKYDEWKNGIITRGKNKGKIRGEPLRFFPCWLSREAKAKPLKEFGKNCLSLIGYTAEEKNRNVKGSRSPLRNEGKNDDWCLIYLFRKGLLRNFHIERNRTGCFDCPKILQKGEKVN